MIWEGLFFMFWHSDKAVYQRDTALKIAKLFSQLEKIGKDKQKLWFEAFAYIFNMHWDKVDNYRIDKYLLFLRFQFNEVLSFLKKNAYNTKDMTWFKDIIKQLFTKETTISQGIPLQICDVFLEELNAVDGLEISTVNLSNLLDPFLLSLSTCENVILSQRIKEKIFIPLLENNITPLIEEEEQEVVVQKEEVKENGEKKWIDGGKLKASTQKDIEQQINQKYQFPHFNILLFAQEYLLKYAAATETREENREIIYQLYDVAHNLEPEPDKPELTYTQRMLVNQASAFMTKKMHKRMKFSVQKKGKKALFKVGNLISAKMFGQDADTFDYTQCLIDQSMEKRQYLNQLNEDFVKENGPTTNGHASNGTSNGTSNGNHVGHENKGSVFKTDTVISIDVNQSKKKKKHKKKRTPLPDTDHLQSDKKRVKFNLDKSQTREFFTHGKVATQKVDESWKKASPTRGVIKKDQNGPAHKVRTDTPRNNGKHM